MGRTQSKITAAVAGLLLVFGATGDASAQGEDFDPDALHGSLSIGVGMKPDYEGSDEYEVTPVPQAQLSWRGFTLFTRGAGAHLDVLPQKTLLGGPVLHYRFGRDRIDDERVSRLPDVDDSLEAGVFFGLSLPYSEDPRERITPMVSFAQDVTNGHGGYLVTGSVVGSHALFRPLVLEVGVSTTFASEDYQESFFGVTEAGAAASGLAPYDPDGGFRDVTLHATLDFYVARSWSIGPTFVYKRLLGESADSPVVKDAGSANQFIGFMSVTWRF